MERCMECGWEMPFPLPAKVFPWPEPVTIISGKPLGVYADGNSGPWRCIPCQDKWEEDWKRLPWLDGAEAAAEPSAAPGEGERDAP
jgi:hypothetical protein